MLLHAALRGHFTQPLWRGLGTSAYGTSDTGNVEPCGWLRSSSPISLIAASAVLSLSVRPGNFGADVGVGEYKTWSDSNTFTFALLLSSYALLGSISVVLTYVTCCVFLTLWNLLRIKVSALGHFHSP
jgi:hypothetical protein